MRKSLLSTTIMILSGWLLLEVSAQTRGSLEQYYSVGAGTSFSLTPIASYQPGKNWHLEGRYNYEELNSFSAYAGKTFAYEGGVSCSFTPLAGFVAGKLNGGSVAANISFEYKKFLFSSQPQYTFSIADKSSKFIYSWNDLGFGISENLFVGVSFQHTKSYREKGLLEKGLLVEASFKKWAFPVYLYNPVSKERYFVLGANFEW